ncbi:DUF309 domain-containing protein [Anaerobacillus sp. CMMVII]|uniref:DUF309 domain-containing protein n=1 Tax=Anaerobacillus sp. CMMVII TaxID=2755588 RepID=UPI0021B6E816|nr:DUF309 domain-containing protein [Anaerobacillus sp. CMMVII]MCT8138814.1 DUF309 domain-containing protein [Anaerobacillus sp. CMMVII]
MYPQRFIDYLVYFHSYRDYFECHEVLEEYWKEDGQKNKLWVGFIQLAVSMYHHRRKNFVGAEKLMKQTIAILKQEEIQLSKLGFDNTTLFNLLTKKYEAIKKRNAYTPITLPIVDKVVLDECLKKSKEQGVIWCDEKPIVDKSIIDKHKVRDRSAIITAREQQLKKKRGS